MDKANCPRVWKKIIYKKRGERTLLKRKCMVRVLMRAVVIQ